MQKEYIFHINFLYKRLNCIYNKTVGTVPGVWPDTRAYPHCLISPER